MEVVSIEHITALIFTYSLRIVGALIIFFVGKKVADKITSVFVTIIKKSTTDETIISFISSAIYIILLMVVVFAALANLGIQTSSFVAILGALGLAVGMAMRDTFSSVGAGILIVFFKPFKVKDKVQVSDVSGVVESINIFSTVLKTPDNKIIIVPNSKVVSANIVNESAKTTRRVDLIFGISYDDDIKKAKQILEDIVENNKKILKNPTYTIAVLELAESSVNITVRAWVKLDDYYEVLFALNEAVKLRFDEENITIPYPQIEISHKRNS